MAAAEGSWGDVLDEGRAPRFALICLGVWLNAADSLVTATIMPRWYTDCSLNVADRPQPAACASDAAPPAAMLAMIGQ